MRAERQARRRRLGARLRALAPSLAVSWRPAMAAVASIALLVVVGDIFLDLHPRVAPPPPLMSSAPPPRPDAAPVVRNAAPAPPPLAFGDETRRNADRVAAPPAAMPPPPPGPAAAPGTAPNTASKPASKRVHTVPIAGSLYAPKSPPSKAAPAARTVDAANEPLPFTEERRARRAAVESRVVARPAPQENSATLAAVPLQAPASAAGGRTREDRDAVPSFAWPLQGRPLADIASAKADPRHGGIDIAVPVGTPIHAAADGLVVYAGNEIKGFGNLVLVRHGGGFVTAYAHLDKILVKVNESVTRGQVIARSGRTGTVAAPLLHFEIRNGSAPVDPAQYLPALR
jgi:murein DD-endopeptidase MepM/ murein hydrolase activator NlpD